MKQLIGLLLIALLYTSCKRDLQACRDYKEVKAQESAVDTSILPQAMKDTLAKYPQLKPYAVANTGVSSNVRCHIYYKDLFLFNNTYALFENPGGPGIESNGKIPKLDAGFSVVPAVSYWDAIDFAKHYINFDHTCISYELGIYDLSPGVADGRFTSYRLAWKIMDSQKTYIYAIVDAQNKQIIYYNSFNGFVN